MPVTSAVLVTWRVYSAVAIDEVRCEFDARPDEWVMATAGWLVPYVNTEANAPCSVAPPRRKLKRRLRRQVLGRASQCSVDSGLPSGHQPRRCAASGCGCGSHS